MKPGFGEADYLLYVDGQAVGVVDIRTTPMNAIGRCPSKLASEYSLCGRRGLMRQSWRFRGSASARNRTTTQVLFGAKKAWVLAQTTSEFSGDCAQYFLFRRAG